jgi:hypothetical protein
LLLLAGCGGGGGGGAPPTTSNAPPPVSAPTDPATAFDTAEYRLNSGLRQINAGAAYAKGIDGTGQTVAVIDTGINTTLAEFAGAVHPASTDIITERKGQALTDVDGHGSAVASIIAGRKNGAQTHGVAYNARIMAVRTESVPTTSGVVSGDFFTDDIARATTYAVTNGASVINYSMGGEGAMPIGLAAALKEAASRDVILVASAGNNGKDTVTNLLALWVTSSDATGHGIAVGSVNANNQISSFSNKAGDSANFYIVAPGEAIRAIDHVGDAVTGTGTSMSAPHVSGAAALLKQAFPHLSGTQIVDLILRTATDLGAPGTDPVYGRGLLNVASAMAPVGTAAIPTETNVGGPSLPLSTSSLRLGAAFGDALASNGALRNSIMLDDYQRAYTVDLTSRVSRPQPRHDLVNWLGGDKNYDYVATPVGTAGQASFSDRTTDRRTVEPTRQGSGRSFSFTSKLGTSTDIGIAAGRPMAARFGVDADKPFALDTISGDPARSAFLGLADSGRNVSIRTDLGDGVSIATGFASRREEDYLKYGDSRSWSDYGDREVVMAELRKSWDGGRVGIQFGQLTERGSALDSSGDSAFAFDTPITTQFAGLFASLDLKIVELFGSWQYGATADAQLGNGLIRSLSGVRSDAWTLGIARSDVVSGGDRLSLSVSQPLRVSAGRAEINAPTGRTDSGTVLRESGSASLTPSGREIDVELAYRIPLSEKEELSTGALVQTSPGHVAGASAAFATAVRYKRRF